MATISDRIKKGLQLRNMKQVDIINKTGINKGALSNYISGRYEPKQKNIFLIAKALDVDEAWLMGHDVPIDRTRRDGVNERDNYDVKLYANTDLNKEAKLLKLFRQFGESQQNKLISYAEFLLKKE